MRIEAGVPRIRLLHRSQGGVVTYALPS